MSSTAVTTEEIEHVVARRIEMAAKGDRDYLADRVIIELYNERNTLRNQVATLTRERDEARAHLLGKGRECDSLYHDIQEAARTGVLPAYAYPHEPSTTPTPGAQA